MGHGETDTLVMSIWANEHIGWCAYRAVRMSGDKDGELGLGIEEWVIGNGDRVTKHWEL